MQILLVFAVTMLLVPQLGTGFLPELDERSIVVRPAHDPSISPVHAAAIAYQVEPSTSVMQVVLC